MYEHVTYEEILKRILGQMPREVDKREGSLIYTAVAPMAAELQLMYIEFDTILRETFAQTASREYLIKRAGERGIYPKQATAAVFEASVVPKETEISQGERFTQGIYGFQVTGKEGDGIYRVSVEKSGTDANHLSGYLIPVEAVPGLQTMTLGELLIPGTDDEDTEHFRKRYLESFDQKSFSGNRQDYLDKVMGISGVGAVKVTRAWNGGGTVKLTIIDSEYGPASDALIEKVQTVIDPTRDGEGAGLAPIDHIVTVVSAKEKEIKVQTHVTFDHGYTYEALQKQMENALSEYLLELRKDWAQKEILTVRISQMEAKILAVRGIVDVSSTMICDQPDNLILGQDEIPLLGGVVIDS